MGRFLLVCLAGAVGTGARYLLNLVVPTLLGPGFPYSTLLVNLVGSFLICLVMQLALSTELISPTLRFVLVTGFMGGLTTYSAFNYELVTMLRERSWGAAALYLTLTVGGGLLAGVGGLLAARLR